MSQELQMDFLRQLLDAEQKAEKVKVNAKAARQDKNLRAKASAQEELDAFKAEQQASLDKEVARLSATDAVAEAQAANAQDLAEVGRDYEANKDATVKYIVAKIRDVNLGLTPTQILSLTGGKKVAPAAPAKAAAPAAPAASAAPAAPAAPAVLAPIDPKAQLKLVRKEGGERGVELEGASQLGGTRFFATCVDHPRGELALVLESLKSMNAEMPKKTKAHAARSGCAGDVAKMIFSANNQQVAVVAHVPQDLQDNLDASDWIEEVLDWFGGDAVESASGQSTGVVTGEGTLMIKAMKQKACEIILRKKLMAEDAHHGDDDVFGEEDLPGIPEARRATILAKRRTMRQSIVG